MPTVAGADVNNNAVTQDGITTFLFAAEGGHLTCLQWLQDNGADINLVDQDGTTAIMSAAELLVRSISSTRERRY